MTIMTNDNVTFYVLFQFYLLVGDALSAPGVGAMKGAVATLDDGGVGELARRRIFEGKEVAPMDAVIADGEAQWRTRPLGLVGQGFEIIINQDMATITEGKSIRTRLVTGDIRQYHIRPRHAIVATVARGQLGIMGAHQHL